MTSFLSARLRSPLFHSLSAVLLVLTATACSEDPAAPEQESPPEDLEVVGYWHAADLANRHVVVTDSTITFHDLMDWHGCYLVERWSVVERSNGIWRAVSVDHEQTAEFELERSGTDLVITTAGDRELYTPADIVIGGPDPCGADAPQAMQGTWIRMTGSLTEYLRVQGPTIEQYLSAEGCYEQEFLDILAVREVDDAFDLTLRLRRRNLVTVARFDPASGGLTVNSGAHFLPSDDDVGELPACPPGGAGADPDLACEDLEPLGEGGVDGLLLYPDPEFRDRYYDLYRLDVAERGTVRLTMDAGQMRPRLYLYESDGTLIAVGTVEQTLVSRSSVLQVTLDPGCYRVEATVLFRGAIGAYRIQTQW